MSRPPPVDALAARQPAGRARARSSPRGVPRRRPPPAPTPAPRPSATRTVSIPVEGPFCHAEGKAELLRALAASRGYDLAASFAYSDSISDVPMLRAVGHTVVVNPEPELRELALTECWQLLDTGALPRVSRASPRDVARLAGRAAGSVVSSVRLPRVVPEA